MTDDSILHRVIGDQVRLLAINQLDDGFKRLRAARSLKGYDQIVGRFLASDEQGAKAAIFNLNRITGRPVELEEAWIIYALVIEDGHVVAIRRSWTASSLRSNRVAIWLHEATAGSNTVDRGQ